MNTQILEAKKQLVDELKQRGSEQSGLIFCGYSGLTVAAVSEFRAELRKLGADYKVIKNSMIRRAFSDIEGLDEHLHWTTGVVFAGDDLAAVAKYVSKFSKDSNEKLIVKCGMMEGSLLSAAQVQAIGDLPPREVLLAQILSSLNAPVTNFVGVMAGVPRKFLYLLNALRDQKESQGA